MSEHIREEAAWAELAAGVVVRAVEVAALVLLALLVTPPLLIMVVVVAAPLLALAAVVAVVAAIVATPVLLVRHVRGRRARHTSLVVSRVRRVRGVPA